MLARLFQPRKEIWDVFDGASWVGTISASTRREAVQLLQSFPRRETLQLLTVPQQLTAIRDNIHAFHVNDASGDDINARLFWNITCLGRLWRNGSVNDELFLALSIQTVSVHLYQEHQVTEIISAPSCIEG